MKKNIPHNRPTLGEREIQAVKNVIESALIVQGNLVSQLEAKLAHFHGLDPSHVVAVSSGSASLFLALIAMGVKKSRVAIPAYSCASLENAVKLAGCIPVYLDVYPGTVDLNLEVEEKFDFLIYPHLFGIPSKISNKYRAITIEDCAQSIGATVEGELVGRQTPISVFSFYATKLMTSAGQGGVVMCETRELADKVRDLINFDCKADGQLRFNFQMTDLQASVGLVQLDRLFGEFIPKRESIFNTYKRHGLDLLDSKEPCLVPVRFRAILKIREFAELRELQRFLEKYRVKTIIPIEESEVLCSQDAKNRTGAIYNTQHFLSIPCYPTLSEKELLYICEKIEDFNNEFIN